MINLTNSEYQFSYFENLYSSKEPQGEMDINELIEVIKYGYLKDVIGELRATEDKEAYNKIKASSLPAVTLSGLFSERNSKGLRDHSGLIQIDIDQVERYDQVLNQVIADEHTYVAFRSPGGDGIKVIVKINPDESTHLEQFYALEQYYKTEFDIEIDKACKDVARCLLLSYDPNIYCNPFSEVFAECYMPEQKEVQQVQYSTSQLNLATSDQEGVIEQITSQIEATGTDITDGYENWIKIGYALSGVLGEGGRDYFHRISSIHSEYDQNKCDRQYTVLNERNSGAISLGTLVFYARQGGIDVQFPRGDQNPVEDTPITPAPKPVFNPEGKSLLQLLKDRRFKLAKEASLPAYCVFSDATLQAMCDVLPETQDQFSSIKGVGLKKVEQYAQHFLPLIRKYKGVDGPVKLSFGAEFQEQKSTTYQFNDREKELYEALRQLRMRISKEDHVKPYWVFGNKTLNELVQLKPASREALLGITGIGEKKVDWFGEEIIEEINAIVPA